MTIIVDIDNTICNTLGNDYLSSKPILLNIAKINRLYDDGNIIIYYTARGRSSNKDWHELTMNQLNKWGCKYNSLMMDKLSYDLWIDDKCKRIEEI